MGSILGHRIGYNGVGALRGQRHIPSKTLRKYLPPGALAEKLKRKKVAEPLVIPQHTYLAHSCSICQIRNVQLSCVCGIISVN